MKAVIFDLFGTVVANLDPPRLVAAIDAIAGELGAPPDLFREAWSETFRHRMDGRLQDGEDQFRDILDSLGVASTATQRRAASEIRRDFMRAALAPKKHAIDCLEELRRQGFKIGMATDCSSETPDLLCETELGSHFEVIASSAHLRVTKPDPRMYDHVLTGLGVSGSDCIYVGDGNSEELVGAKRHGMLTVWVDNGDQQHWRERFVPEGDHEIRCLSELVSLADAARRG